MFSSRAKINIFGGSTRVIQDELKSNNPEPQVKKDPEATELIQPPCQDEEKDEPKYLPGEKLLLKINKKQRKDKRGGQKKKESSFNKNLESLLDQVGL